MNYILYRRVEFAWLQRRCDGTRRFVLCKSELTAILNTLANQLVLKLSKFSRSLHIFSGIVVCIYKSVGMATENRILA